ncbi:DUF5134 domain-containing protein [Ruania albidiflava]|uniref:DUF5134 domain-containing protein n=1 Tax=Ruania albidiflava TaxID=366586 RepID=UPI0003B66566|nr:DUF5134 domain-containing protein [Ruania albidiflava]
MDPVLQWMFTAVFLAVAGHCVIGLADFLRPVVRGGAGERADGVVERRTAIAHLCHLLMSLAMAAMAWPWWTHLPATPQVVVFALAAAWFVVQTRTATAGRLRYAVDAVMMLAMVWMVAVMGYGPHATAAGTTGAMGGHQHGMLAPAQVAVGLVFTVAMLAAAVTCATGRTSAPASSGMPAARRSTVLHRRADVAARTAMSTGMAAMCWLMVAS